VGGKSPSRTAPWHEACKIFHCGCRIVGHGVEVEDEMFCCAHCAKRSGMQGVADRV